VVFAGPLLAFLALHRIPQRLVVRCFILLGLGGLQGLVGWWMVESGLEGRVSVAPERLATHLGLALLLYAALIWTGLEALNGPARPARHPRASIWPWATPLLAALVYVQCLLGALVAGNRAGLVDNDWPLMNGRVFPADYRIGGVWQSLLHSQAAVQFNHRLMGYTVAVIALALAALAARAREAPGALRALVFSVAALVVAQASLGIMTLLARAPLPLSQLHQALAAIVLGAAVALAWRGLRA
jgi:cytochrome c oxidase assembly protein subunit 15